MNVSKTSKNEFGCNLDMFFITWSLMLYRYDVDDTKLSIGLSIDFKSDIYWLIVFFKSSTF